MTEKKQNMVNLRKARNAPRHQYDDTPYCDRGEKLRIAFRKYLIREETEK